MLFQKNINLILIVGMGEGPPQPAWWSPSRPRIERSVKRLSLTREASRARLTLQLAKGSQQRQSCEGEKEKREI